MACVTAEMAVPREWTQSGLPFTRQASLRLVDAEAAATLFSPVYDRVRRRTPGMISRSADWWRLRTLADPEDRRDGGGPKRFVVAEIGGQPVAYAIYRHQHAWGSGAIPAGRLLVLEAIADGYTATRELWRYLLDIDWVATIAAEGLPTDHPLLFILAHPRRAGLRLSDGLWVRLVDLPAALSRRRYGAPGRGVFEVSDPVCTWNGGRGGWGGGRRGWAGGRWGGAASGRWAAGVPWPARGRTCAWACPRSRRPTSATSHSRSCTAAAGPSNCAVAASRAPTRCSVPTGRPGAPRTSSGPARPGSCLPGRSAPSEGCANRHPRQTASRTRAYPTPPPRRPDPAPRDHARLSRVLHSSGRPPPGEPPVA